MEGIGRLQLSDLHRTASSATGGWSCWNISVIVSNLGLGRQQVPCYLSEFLAFKCYFCHVFVMCAFNTSLKLSAEYWSCSTTTLSLYMGFEMVAFGSH